jgi:hypothetical protein
LRTTQSHHRWLKYASIMFVSLRKGRSGRRCYGAPAGLPTTALRPIKSPRLSSTSLDVLPPVLPTQQRCKLVRGLHFDPRRILNSSIPLVPGDRTNREGVRRQGWLHVPYIGAHPFLTVFYATVNMETRHAVTQPRIARILHLATHHRDTLQPRVAPQQVLGVWDGVDWGFRPHCVNDIYTVTAACSACFSNINQLHQLLLLS